MRGVWASGPVTRATARALARWICALWGRHEGSWGGAPPAWVWGVRHRALSKPRPPVSWGVRPGSSTHWLWVRGMLALGPVTNPTARALASWLCALWGRHEGAWAGASCLCVGRLGSGALSSPSARPLGRAAGAHYQLAVGARVRAWGPVTNPTARALASWLFALRGRPEGARGGCVLPGCVASGVGRSPGPDHPSFGACGRGPRPTGCGCGVRGWGPGCPWHLVPCRGWSCVVRASRVCGTRWPLWLGTCPRAVVVAGGVPLWRALCPRVGAPHLVWSGASRCSGRPSPTPWAVAPSFTGWLPGARGGPPRTGLIVPAAGPCRGKGAGLAPRPTRFGPRDGVVPGGSPRLRSWAECTSVVWRLWTRSLTRPVSRTVPLLTGDSAGAPGLFCVALPLMACLGAVAVLVNPPCNFLRHT